MRVSSLFHGYLTGFRAERSERVEGIRADGRLLLGASPGKFGLSVYRGDYAAAFSSLEALLAEPGVRAEFSFLDIRSVFRQLIDREYRTWLGRQILLPSGRLIPWLLSGRAIARGKPSFSPRTFVPALLTFVERPLKILVTGEDAAGTQALCDHLQAHAPWHRLIAVAPDRLSQAPPVDMVLFSRRRVSPQDRMRLGTVRCALVIFAGDHLAGFTVSAARPLMPPRLPHASTGTGGPKAA
jgi:hypothetical protein